MRFLGWDIGGVHLKLSSLSAGGDASPAITTRIVPFEIWKEPAGLGNRLRLLRRSADEAVTTQAVTMTAELSDLFTSRAEGVRAILGACGEAFGREPFLVLDRRGELVSTPAALERPEEVAAANWMATASLASRRCRDAVLIDTGSTTTDIIPIVASRPCPSASTDTGRLMSGELVYSGALRTSPASFARQVPLRGGWCRIAPEHFAQTADIYRLLGQIDEQAYTVPTPDGRGRGRAESAARLARLVCGETGDLGEGAIDLLARFLFERQADLLAEAILQVLGRRPELRDKEAVVAGIGWFLAAAAAARAGLPVRRLCELLPAIGGAAWDTAAPSGALALMLAERRGVLDLRPPA